MSASSGFLYCIARAGITGTHAAGLSESTAEYMRRVRSVTDLPLALGFGISTPTQVREAAASGADAVVVGSALISEIDRAIAAGEPVASAVEKWTRALADALHKDFAALVAEGQATKVRSDAARDGAEAVAARAVLVEGRVADADGGLVLAVGVAGQEVSAEGLEPGGIDGLGHHVTMGQNLGRSPGDAEDGGERTEVAEGMFHVVSFVDYGFRGFMESCEQTLCQKAQNPNKAGHGPCRNGKSATERDIRLGTPIAKRDDATHCSLLRKDAGVTL